VNRAPLISVIIPTRHRIALLSRCLEELSAERQRFSSDNYEVIVTDDGVQPTAEELIRTKHPWVRWVAGPRKGPAANRNNGARHARGEWLAFTDDDCEPASEWLNEIARAIHTSGADIIEGKTIIPDKRDNPFLHAVENLDGGNYWTCNLAIRKSVFFESGAFDEDFLEPAGEDMEFAHRIRKNSIRAMFCPEALVRHPVRPVSWRELCHRSFFLIRWIALYRLKTEGTPPSVGLARTVLEITTTQVVSLLRASKQALARLNGSNWRTELFFQAWNWLTFPGVLPLWVYWHWHFRQQFQRSRNQ
jgi:GT2 family glycosyltransferase